MQLLKALKIVLQFKWLVLIFITCLYVFINIKVINYKSIYSLNDNKFVGIIEKIKETDYGYSLTIKTPEELIVYTNNSNYQLGDKVYIEGKLEIPSNNTILNTFNYKDYLYHNIWIPLKVKII